MFSLLLLILQETEKSTAGKIAYSVGYFMGSNFWTIVSIAVVILVAILYLAFFRGSKKNNWS